MGKTLAKIFSSRAKMPVPGLNALYQSGISDSLYQPRPKEWYAALPSASAKVEESTEAAPAAKENAYEQYFTA